jgi:hypothetical protein
MWPFRQQNGILAARQPSSASNRRRVFHMKSDLAIASLIRSRMTELGLSRGELAKRLGYKNLPKGIRRMDVLCDGDVGETKQFLDVLPQALETSAETVKRALDQTVREIELAEKQEAEARDKIWRENFCPHAIILTERSVPSPIFVAAMIGVEKLLRIDLDATQGPVSFVRQVLDRLPEGVPAFGKPIGFVINYSPDKAVRFDPTGNRSQFWIRPSVPGPPFSALGGVWSLPRRWGWFSVNRLEPRADHSCAWAMVRKKRRKRAPSGVSLDPERALSGRVLERTSRQILLPALKLQPAHWGADFCTHL